jgi:hypothetical protein
MSKRSYVHNRVVRDNLSGKAVDFYDFAVHGGAQATITLPLELESQSIITSGFVYVDTPCVGSGASIAVGLNTNTDLLAATGVASFTDNAVLNLIPSTTANISGDGHNSGVSNNRPLVLTADRQLKVTISGAALTAGKLAIVLFYVGPFDGVRPVTYSMEG